MFLSVSEQSFAEEVLESSIPVVVNFWAPWCGICRVINPLLSQFQAQYHGKIKLVSINADESLKLASTYRLTTLPTVLLVQQGKVTHRLDTFHGRDDFRQTLEKMMSNTLNLVGS